MKAKKRTHKRFTLGPLPLLHVISQRMGLSRILSEHIHKHGNERIDPAEVLLLLVYNLTISKSPLYELEDWINRIDLKSIGIINNSGVFSDDRFANALDKLFKADRSTLLTDLVLSYVRAFNLELNQFHNDSTTVKACGKYPEKSESGFELKRGHSKDHRPDLKQLVYNLTISADCAVPVHHRCYSGNRTDDTTHIETWETLHRIFGRTDFLYVADSKLCTEKQLEHIVSAGGRAITIVPETWNAVIDFKKELKLKAKTKKIIWRRTKPGTENQEEYFSAFSGKYFSRSGYRIHWVYSSAKNKRDHDSREERLERTENALSRLNAQLNKGNYRNYEKIKTDIDKLLNDNNVTSLLDYEISTVSFSQKEQVGRGRPGSATKYQIKKYSHYSLKWHRNKKNIKLESHVDGIFPLLSTDNSLNTKEVVKAYKFQPRLEKRFAQFKNIQNAAPLLFKKIERIEANMFAFFISLALQALLEREIRNNMVSSNLDKLYIYPEDRKCKAPTASVVFDRFANVSRYEISENGIVVENYRDELTSAQKEILSVLNITEDDYWNVNC